MPTKKNTIPLLVRQLAKKLPHFDDGRIDYRSSTRMPVVMCFLCYDNKVLLLKRSEHVAHYKGKWNAISGHLDELEPVEEKAFQEIEEEVGITKAEIASVKKGKIYRMEDKSIGKKWMIHPLLVRLKTRPAIRLNKEHTEYLWVDQKDLTKYDHLPELEHMLKRVL